MPNKWLKSLFQFAAAYDFILGLLFFFFFKSIYNSFGVPLPNHDGYVQFAALLVTIFGIGFWFVSQDPLRNRDIIKMGILLKTAYFGTVFYHSIFGVIPFVWVPFAWIDLGFCALFVWALQTPKTKA